MIIFPVSIIKASRILTKQATHDPESKLLETSDREKRRQSSRMHVLCIAIAMM